jgi:hypothetical protein
MVLYICIPRLRVGLVSSLLQMTKLLRFSNSCIHLPPFVGLWASPKQVSYRKIICFLAEIPFVGHIFHFP